MCEMYSFPILPESGPYLWQLFDMPSPTRIGVLTYFLRGDKHESERTKVGKSASFVIVWRFLERAPLLAVMAKDDQCHVLTLDYVKEFARAGAQLLLVVVYRCGFTFRRKQALQDNSVDGQQHRAGLREANQD